jgi:enoyl reductase-like protein
MSDNTDNLNSNTNTTESNTNTAESNYIDLDLQFIPFANNTKSNIQKFHIVKKDGHTLKHRICNVFAPFGRQTSSEHKVKTNANLTQHRLNVCFTPEQVNLDKNPYKELHRLITELESYFGSFDELKTMNLQSNIINRNQHGIVIRFHLKTNKNHTVTPLVQTKQEDLENAIHTEWIAFDKNKQFNFDFHPDSLWIDNVNNKYGISLMIDKVFQII